MATNERSQHHNIRFSTDSRENVADKAVTGNGEAIPEASGADGVVEITVSTEPFRPQRSLDNGKSDSGETASKTDNTLDVSTIMYINHEQNPVTPRRYRPIAPKGKEHDQTNGDYNEENMVYWRTVLKLRQIMLDNKKGSGYNFTRNEILKFNEIARKQIKEMPVQIGLMSNVAYLDPESWNLATTIVERLKSGTLNGKGYPTTSTFRFLTNCKTQEQKQEKLLSYLQYNSVGALKKCKKRQAVQPFQAKYKQNSDDVAGLREMVQILEDRVKQLEKQVSKSRLEKEQLNKDIQRKDIEIYQLNGELRTYSNRVADLELSIARQELKIRETEKDKNLRVKELTQNVKEWKDLYYQSIGEEEGSVDQLVSSLGNLSDNAMSDYDPADSAVDAEDTDIQESDEESTEEVSSEEGNESTSTLTSRASCKAKLKPGDFVAFTRFTNTFYLGRVTRGNVSKDEVAVEYGQARPNNEYDFRKKKRDTVKREQIFKWGADINAKFMRSATWRVNRTLLEKEHKTAVKMLRGKRKKNRRD